jgi:hypothetical protein
MDALKIFHEYKGLGYKVIPLITRTKRPLMKGWNQKYSFNKIENFLKLNNGNYNFGILLGDIIDIEGDSSDANDFLEDLFKDIPHAIYKSSKSTHHLFRMGDQCFTRIICNTIEFRGHGHQSVVPPSVHEDGTKYIWVTKKYHINELPVLPKDLEIKIKRFKSRNSNYTKPHSKKIHCANCRNIFFVNKKRLPIEIQVVKSLGEKWMCHKCRTYDTRPLIREFKLNTELSVY